MDAIVVLLALCGLAIAARRWGVDSTDDFNSPEWERRRRWRGLKARAHGPLERSH